MVLLAALPQVDDLLCDLCTSGHFDLVFILPELSVAEVEQARDKLYLFDDTSGLQEVFQLKSSADDSQALEEVEELEKLEEANGTKREGFTASGFENDALGSTEDLTNETAVGFAQVTLPEDQLNQNITFSPSQKQENEIKTTINFEQTLAIQADDDPGADFEIMYEESFLGSTRGSFGAFEDSGIKSISDVESLSNPKSLESLTGPGPVKGGGSTRDSGIANMDDFDRSPPEWKKSASPMVYTCHNCNYKSFTRIMLNRHNLEKHEGSINKRRLTIANTENLRTLSCESCSYSTKWKQALELHMISNHEDRERKEDSKKRKRVFESPLMRTLSTRPQFKFVKMQSEAKFLKTCFSPEPSHRPKRRKDEEIYGFAREFTCHNCDFKTFLQTRFTKHIETDHLRT